MSTNKITCSFTVDRDIYNAYKSIVVKGGENVKGNLIRYMLNVINYETPNADTISAIKEVEELKKIQTKKPMLHLESFQRILLRIVPSQKFNRDVKLAIKRGYNIQLLDDVVEMIAEQQLLPPEYKDYKLIGNYSGCRECHITPDWLLIYEISNEELILYLTITGTHSDLFQAS